MEPWNNLGWKSNEHSTWSLGHEEGWGQQYPALGEIAECRGRTTNSLCDQGASPVQGHSRPTRWPQGFRPGTLEGKVEWMDLQ